MWRVEIIEGGDGTTTVDGTAISSKVSLDLDATKEVTVEVAESASTPAEFLWMQFGQMHAVLIAKQITRDQG